jgi:hypothetical protein
MKRRTISAWRVRHTGLARQRSSAERNHHADCRYDLGRQRHSTASTWSGLARQWGARTPPSASDVRRATFFQVSYFSLPALHMLQGVKAGAPVSMLYCAAAAAIRWPCGAVGGRAPLLHASRPCRVQLTVCRSRCPRFVRPVRSPLQSQVNLSPKMPESAAAGGAAAPAAGAGAKKSCE